MPVYKLVTWCHSESFFDVENPAFAGGEESPDKKMGYFSTPRKTGVSLRLKIPSIGDDILKA
jgi:hypothetical protein